MHSYDYGLSCMDCHHEMDDFGMDPQRCSDCHLPVRRWPGQLMIPVLAVMPTWVGRWSRIATHVILRAEEQMLFMISALDAMKT
jgi:hypothetical protein